MTCLHKSCQEDLDWAIGLNRRSLRLIGAWPNDGHRFDNKSLRIIPRIPIMIIILIFGHLLPSIYALTLVIHNLPLVVNNLVASSSTITSCTKLFFIWRNNTVLQPVIQSMVKDWLCYKPRWKLETMKREASRGRRLTIGSYLIMAITWTGFALSPFIKFNTRPISNITDYGDRYLISQAYFPYDYTKSPIFELTQLIQVICGGIIAISLSIPDNYFGILIFHIGGQFKILGIKIENLIQNDGFEQSSHVVDYKQKLSFFIKRHVHLIKMINRIEYSFSYIIFAEILGISILFVSLGFTIVDMLTNIKSQYSTFQFLIQLIFLLNLKAHTFLICFACELLKANSTNIFYNIYKSYWYTIPHKMTRDLIPMMIISKNSRQLKAGSVLQLSFISYCIIIKSVLGYISVFIAINRK